MILSRPSGNSLAGARDKQAHRPGSALRLRCRRTSAPNGARLASKCPLHFLGRSMVSPLRFMSWGRSKTLERAWQQDFKVFPAVVFTHFSGGCKTVAKRHLPGCLPFSCQTVANSPARKRFHNGVIEPGDCVALAKQNTETVLSETGESEVAGHRGYRRGPRAACEVSGWIRGDGDLGAAVPVS